MKDWRLIDEIAERKLAIPVKWVIALKGSKFNREGQFEVRAWPAAASCRGEVKNEDGSSQDEDGSVAN